MIQNLKIEVRAIYSETDIQTGVEYLISFVEDGVYKEIHSCDAIEALQCFLNRIHSVNSGWFSNIS